MIDMSVRDKANITRKILPGRAHLISSMGEGVASTLNILRVAKAKSDCCVACVVKIGLKVLSFSL